MVTWVSCQYYNSLEYTTVVFLYTVLLSVRMQLPGSYQRRAGIYKRQAIMRPLCLPLHKATPGLDWWHSFICSQTCTWETHTHVFLQLAWLWSFFIFYNLLRFYGRSKCGDKCKSFLFLPSTKLPLNKGNWKGEVQELLLKISRNGPLVDRKLLEMGPVPKPVQVPP